MSRHGGAVLDVLAKDSVVTKRPPSPLTRIALRRDAVADWTRYPFERPHEIAFRETDGYAIGSRFFADPERYMRRLLDDTPDTSS